MLTLSITSNRRPTLRGPLLMGTAKLKIIKKTVVKKHSQNNVKTRKLMIFDQETLELFMKKVAQYLVQEQVLPKTWKSQATANEKNYFLYIA